MTDTKYSRVMLGLAVVATFGLHCRIVPMLTNRKRGVTPRQLEIACLLRDNPQAGSTQIAQQLNVQPSVVWRIVRTLMQRGVVVYDRDRWQVRLPQVVAPIKQLSRK